MTNKEAIEILRQRKNCMECVMSITTKNMCDKCDAAFDLAIKALEFIDENFPKTFIDYLNDEQI